MSPFMKIISNNFYILTPKYCKNELERLQIITNKSTNRKLVNVQVFPASAHQA